MKPELEAAVDSYLEELKRRFLEIQQAFDVVCDETNNNQEDIDEGRLNLEIRWKN